MCTEPVAIVTGVVGLNLTRRSSHNIEYLKYTLTKTYQLGEKNDDRLNVLKENSSRDKIHQ